MGAHHVAPLRGTLDRNKDVELELPPVRSPLQTGTDGVVGGMSGQVSPPVYESCAAGALRPTPIDPKGAISFVGATCLVAERLSGQQVEARIARGRVRIRHDSINNSVTQELKPIRNTGGGT